VLIAAPEGLHRETTEAPWARTLGALANSLQLPVTVVSQVEDVDPIRRCLSDEQERSMEVVLASSDLAERTREEAQNDDLVIVPALRGGEGPSGLEQRIAEMLHEKTRISFMVLHAPAAAEEAGKAAD
jgi:anaerobic glycerol-3-phosphate dehydrogenase